VGVELLFAVGVEGLGDAADFGFLCVVEFKEGEGFETAGFDVAGEVFECGAKGFAGFTE